MTTHATVVQLQRQGPRSKYLSRMARRPLRGPTDQKRITLPAHFWALLEDIAEMQTESFSKMGGRTTFTVSDLLESGAEMYLRSLVEDLGPLPTNQKERAAFIEKLVENNKRELLSDLLRKTH